MAAAPENLKKAQPSARDICDDWLGKYPVSTNIVFHKNFVLDAECGRSFGGSVA